MAAVSEALELLCEPIGESPHIGVHLKPVKAADDRYPANGFECQLGKSVLVSEMRNALCKRLGIAEEASVLMHEGQDLKGSKTLAENDVNLPGPARRRAGEKVEVLFDLVWDHQSLVREADREAERIAEEQRLIEQAKKEEEMRIQKMQERDQAQHDLEDMELELDRQIGRMIGYSEQQVQEKAASDPEFVVPPHRLETVTEEVRNAVTSLFAAGNNRGGGGNVNVVRCYRVINPTLEHRYKRARQNLLQAETTKHFIKPFSVASMDLVQQNRNLYSPLGDFEARVNEFPLWHGTPTATAAGGICSTGFDTAHVNHGSAYGPGFYFAGNSSISHSYCRGWSINRVHPNVKVMFLCRVLCGNAKETANVTTEEEKERWTSECLGPGGTFGASSAFHSIYGNKWAHVCMHRDQVYPEYVLVFK